MANELGLGLSWIQYMCLDLYRNAEIKKIKVRAIEQYHLFVARAKPISARLWHNFVAQVYCGSGRYSATNIIAIPLPLLPKSCHLSD